MRFKEVMDADDVGMLKPRQRASFVQKPLQAPLKVRRHLRRLRDDG